MLHLIICYTLLLAFFVTTSMCLILKFRHIEEEIDDRNETVDDLRELITENAQLIGEMTLVLEEACDKITKLRFERKLDRSVNGREHEKQTERWMRLGSEISKMKDHFDDGYLERWSRLGAEISKMKDRINELQLELEKGEV